MISSGSTDLQGVKVAVYVSAPGTQAAGSAIALVNMFSWMNASVELTNESHIKGGGLADYDILVMPGGSTIQYIAELGQEGEQNVRDFVLNGGSYFGICGGARLACDEGLRLLNGSYRTPVPGLDTGIYMIELTLNNSSGIPSFSEEPDAFSTLYWGSAYFDPDNPAGMMSVAVYPNSTLAAMIALKYGQGSVFLSSPHPEYEEDSARDGTSAFDYLNDTDSEWGLMLKIAQWLINTSDVTMTTTTNTIAGYDSLLLYALALPVAALTTVALVAAIRRR